MAKWSSIDSFLEPAPVAPAAELRDIWRSAHTRVTGSELSALKIRSSDAGNWWVCSVEGTGPTTIKGDFHSIVSPDYVLLCLTFNGRYQSSPRPHPIGEANTLTMCRWSADLLGPVVTWGVFQYFIFYLPTSSIEKQFANGAPPYGKSIHVNDGCGAVVGSCLKTFAREVLRGGSQSLPALQDQIVEMVAQTFGIADAPSKSGHGPSFESVSAYIEDHLIDPLICPRSIASACGLSERQFYRIFERRGETFGNFIRQLRVERAAHFLRSGSDAAIADIAYDCGFNSPSYFGQIFRDYFGTSPSEYRSLAADGAAVVSSH